MSYGIHPIALSLDKLSAQLGSGKQRLLKKINKRFGHEFEEIDELDEDCVSVSDALTHLVLGEALDENSGFKYGYALKQLCRLLGEELTNVHWSAMRSEWFEEFDCALEDQGVPEDILRSEMHFAGRGSPVPLPPIDDFPAISYLRNEEMAAIAQALSTVGGDPDDDVGQSIGEVQYWLKHCRHKHQDIIFFYH